MTSMGVLTTSLLILGSYTTATCQMGVPAASSSPDWKAGSLSSAERSEKDKSPQALAPALRTLLTATKVLVVGEPSVLYSTSKAEQAFKKALVRWGRFQVVDNAETADRIIVISEYSSSKPKIMERITESVAIFVGGSAPSVDATPLWAVRELGPELGQRPTGRLVEDLREYLTKLEESSAAGSTLSTT
jgi:hypothetical protein